MKHWISALSLLALGLAGVAVGWRFFDFSIWVMAPSVVLVLIGLMPLSAAKEQLRQDHWAQREKDAGKAGQGRGDAA